MLNSRLRVATMLSGLALTAACLGAPDAALPAIEGAPAPAATLEERVLLPLIATASPTGDAWSPRAALLTPRQEIAVAELDDKVYTFGGYGSQRETLDSTEVYDPTIDEWRLIAPMPIGLHHPSAGVVDGVIYVIGGYEGRAASSAVLAYDPATDGWTRKSDMPTARGALAAAVVAGQIYVAGGARGVSVDDFARYDPATDTWTPLPPMPTPRDHLGAAVIDGKIYVVGGRQPGNFTLATLERFDPSTNEWQTLTPMPTGRSGHAVAALYGCLYAMGGEGSDLPGGTFPENERYSPQRDMWEIAAPMPTPRHGMGAVTLGGAIHAPAGADVRGFGAVTTHELFQSPVIC